MGGVDGDTVASILESDGGVDDEALSAANAEIGMDEENVPLLLRKCWLLL